MGINSQQLKDALTVLDAVSLQKTTMNILRFIKIENEADKLYLSASSLDQNLTICVDYSGNDVSACLPSKELKDIVATVRSETVELEQTEEYVYLKDGRHKTKFKWLPTDEFPVVNENLIGNIKIDGKILQDMLLKSEIACSEETSRVVLTGINLLSRNGTLTSQAADGFRASSYTMMLGTSDFEINIPKIDKRILKLFEGTINVNITKNKATFGNDVFIYDTSFIDGNFPEVGRIIPTSYNCSVTIERAKLTNAVKRAMIFAKNTDNVISFSLAEGMLNIFSSDDTGENKMSFNVDSDCEFEFNINGKYMMDFLSVAGNMVKINVIDGLKPIALLIPEKENFIHIIMPMHLGRR